MIYEEQYKKSFDELEYENMFYDVFIVILWIPYIIFNFIRFLLSLMYYFTFKIMNFLSKLFANKKKKE
jgi:hypothetical protein